MRRPAVRAFADFLDDLGHERLQIAGIAAGDDALIRHDRLVAPSPPALITSVLIEWYEVHFVPLIDAGLDQEPRRMADRRHHLAGINRSARMISIAFGSTRSLSGLIWPPGSTSASYSAGSTSSRSLSTETVLPQSVLSQP